METVVYHWNLATTAPWGKSDVSMSDETQYPKCGLYLVCVREKWNKS